MPASLSLFEMLESLRFLWNFDGANYYSGFSFMTKATKSSISGLKHKWMMHIWFFNLEDHWTIFAWLVSMLKRKQQACAKSIDNPEHQCNIYGTWTPHARRQCLDMLQSPCCRRPSAMKQSWCADASNHHLIWRSGILSYLYLWFIWTPLTKNCALANLNWKIDSTSKPGKHYIYIYMIEIYDKKPNTHLINQTRVFLEKSILQRLLSWQNHLDGYCIARCASKHEYKV